MRLPSVHPIEFVVYTVLIVLAAFAIAVTASAAEERIVDLPQDAGKWFVSVIGDPDDAQYQAIVKWFDADGQLSELRNQVHFWNVPTDGPDYEARYAWNTQVLPTIRIQKPSGSVVWERSSGEIPATAGGMYSEIYGASQEAMGIFPLLPWRRAEPYLPVFPLRKNGVPNLPWRRRIENELKQDRCPAPAPIIDVDAGPPSDGGSPVMPPPDSGPSTVLGVGLAILSALAGGGWGVLSQWKKITTTE